MEIQREINGKSLIVNQPMDLCLTLTFAWLMTTMPNIKHAWLRTISITENVRNYKIRASQSMPWKPNAVLGHTKELFSTKVYLTRKKEKLSSVVKKFQPQVKNHDS
jgi:hypothetical protein